MSILGTLEGIGAGDPWGAAQKSNITALDQAGSQAAGKALIALFNPQVPGAQPMGGPPVSAGMPPSVRPPTAPPLPPSGPQPYAQAGPSQAAVPGAQPMPSPVAAPQGPPGGGPAPGLGGPGQQPNPQSGDLQRALQQNAQLLRQRQQLQQLQGGGTQGATPVQTTPQLPSQGTQSPSPSPQVSPQPAPAPTSPPRMPGPPPGLGSGPSPGMGGGAPMGQSPGMGGGPMQQVAQGIQRSQGQLDWRTLVQAVVKSNPGATPEVIAGAVNKLLPLMQADSLQQWRQIQAQLGVGRLYQGQERIEETGRYHDESIAARERGLDISQQRADTGAAGQAETARHHGVAEGISQQRADTGAAGQEDTARHRRVTEEQGERRLTLATTREGRLDRQGQARIDQRYQQLDNERQRLQVLFQKTKNGEDGRKWREALDAQRQHMRTKIAADPMAAGPEKQKLLDENEAWYNQQIREMRRDQPGSFSNKFTPAETMTPAQQAQ
jgi:hypothetical protein